MINWWTWYLSRYITCLTLFYDLYRHRQHSVSMKIPIAASRLFAMYGSWKGNSQFLWGINFPAYGTSTSSQMHNSIHKRRQYFNTLLIYVTVFMFYYSTYASVSCLIRTFRTKIKENHPFPHLRSALKPIKEATTTYTVVKCYKCTPISSHDNIFRCLQTYSLWRKPVSRLLLW